MNCDQLLGLVPELCQTQRECIYMIPDVKYLTANKSLNDCLDYQALYSLSVECPKIWGGLSEPPLILSNYEYYNSVVTDHKNKKYLTPIGAQVLVRLLDKGLVAQHKKVSGNDISELIAYSNSLSRLLELSAEHRVTKAKLLSKAKENRAATTARIQYLLKHPEDAVANDFSRSFLNQYSWAIGPGSKSFQLGEAHVKVEVAEFRSNSGKKQPTDVDIRWTLKDGSTHGDVKGPRRLNRRMDPNRGIGR